MTTKILAARPAGTGHAVLTLNIKGGLDSYRRQPCPRCPWRVDAVGAFPPEAFRHSAATGYDGSMIKVELIEQAMHGFACHSSGAEKPALCAGYILRSPDAIGWRIAASFGKFDPHQVSDGGHALHENYYAMAVANGVPPEDPVLDGCPRPKPRRSVR